MGYPGARSPSAWGDVTRSPGHDEMQFGVADWLRENFLNDGYTPPCTESEDKPRLLKYKIVECEKPIIVDGRIVSFADIELRMFGPGSDYTMAYEIKPRVDSVGAILRQLHAQAHLIRATMPPQPSYAQWQDMWLVIRANDPKRALMQKAYSKTLVWTGSTVGV